MLEESYLIAFTHLVLVETEGLKREVSVNVAVFDLFLDFSFTIFVYFKRQIGVGERRLVDSEMCESLQLSEEYQKSEVQH